jgi:hypothetical protein
MTVGAPCPAILDEAKDRQGGQQSRVSSQFHLPPPLHPVVLFSHNSTGRGGSHQGLSRLISGTKNEGLP